MVESRWKERTKGEGREGREGGVLWATGGEIRPKIIIFARLLSSPFR